MRLISLPLLALLFGCDGTPPTHNPITTELRERAVSSTNLANLPDTLERIASYHRDMNTGIELRPGASDSAIDDLEALLGCSIPDELRLLWQWRNGEATDRFGWYHRFLSIEDSLAEYEDITSTAGRWQRDWVPVFEFQEEWYGIECADDRRAASPVVFFFIEDVPKVSHSSLSAYLNTMEAAIANGSIWWDISAWNDDPQKLADTFAEFNPGLAFPYYVPTDD